MVEHPKDRFSRDVAHIWNKRKLQTKNHISGYLSDSARALEGSATGIKTNHFDLEAQTAKK